MLNIYAVGYERKINKIFVFFLLCNFPPISLCKVWKLYTLKTSKDNRYKKVILKMTSSNNSVNNGFFQQLIILYIDHFRYSFVACNECLFWLLRTENHPVMVAEDFIHSWDSINTWELMEKLILSYQCIRPWSNKE